MILSQSSSASIVPYILKRDGRKVSFEADRITRAISNAIFEQKHGSRDNPNRRDKTKMYGLSDDDYLIALDLTNQVVSKLEANFSSDNPPSVENIQDRVILTLMENNRLEVAKTYLTYRVERASLRLRDHGDMGLSDYIALTKYCRYDERKGRREVFAEAVSRVTNMHLRRFSSLRDTDLESIKNALIESGDIPSDLPLPKFGTLSDEIKKAFEAVKHKHVLPSMRSLQFGGQGIEAKEARMFNCSYSPANRTDFFKEYYYLLLCGTGCGFSVQKHHIAQIPALAPITNELDLAVNHFHVEDTIEGWSDALDTLINDAIRGVKTEFAFYKIRQRGAHLKTSGGKAPGHLPLKRALEQVEKILRGAAGRHLRPIEVYDICMYVAQSVLSGGIRRSATICLFSADDEEMMNAKTGDWFSTHPHRSASNNSVVIVRGQTDRALYEKCFEAQKKFGEPGFFFTNDVEYGANPCLEILLNPNLPITAKEITKLRALGYKGTLEEGQVLTGWQFCNLVTINGAECSEPETFYLDVVMAAIIGTLQASYTKMPYLGPVTQCLNEREALLGISICGILDQPGVLLVPKVLQIGAAVAKAVNAIIAKAIGINRAARLTCVKPEGTASLILGAGSGIHPHHARSYFRRVQAATNDPVYRYFKQINPGMCSRSVRDKNGATDIITFCVTAPTGAYLRKDLTALKHLEIIRLVQENWVCSGNYSKAFTNGNHNVSCTVTVGPGEWDEVRDYIYNHMDTFTGIAMLSDDGDKVYAEAPREEVTSDEDRHRWNSMQYTPVDYTKIKDDDETAGHAARAVGTACAGGQCEIAA